MTEKYRNKIDYGFSETKFKTRYANDRKSFKNRKYKTDTELSNGIWKLKEQNKNFDIIMGNSTDTSVVQHSNKTMHAISKRKISNSATQTRQHFKQKHRNYKQM